MFWFVQFTKSPNLKNGGKGPMGAETVGEIGSLQFAWIAPQFAWIGWTEPSDRHILQGGHRATS